MNKHLVATVSIKINTTPLHVWKALTDPELIKQYLFDTETISDWKVGSSIVYKGVWQGKTYEDMGQILQISPEKLLQSTYWSSMSGTENKPENYATITYSLQKEGTATRLILTQDNNPNTQAKEQSEKNWTLVLETMKGLLER